MPEDRLKLAGVTLDNKYRIDAVVAEGGFALVYRATHLVWNRPVAVKAFDALAELPESQRASLVEEFLREGALLAELSERSAAIVQARDVGTLTTSAGDHVPYMILEWLDGATLESILRSERAQNLPPRTPAETVALLEPIAEALALAHSKGIAHRDVKPPNIFVMGEARSANCALKLLDFGIAKVVQDAQKMSGSFTKTSGNVTSFTPAYGAPEQFSRTHGATGPWTDVFAFALVCVEILAAKEPLAGDTFVQLGYAASDRERRPTPRTLGADVPDAVEQVFAKALAVTIEDRYATAGEFWNALRASLAMSPMRAGLVTTSPKPGVDANAFAATAVAPPASQPTLAPKPSRGPIVFGLVAIVVLSLSIVGYRAYLRATLTSASSASAPLPMMSAAASCPSGALLIPGGPFYMGTNEPPPDKKYLENEKPAHPVNLSPYCIDRFEVTVERFAACSDSGKCLRASKTNEVTPPLNEAQRKAYDPLCNENQRQAHATHPINCVDWDQAGKFCKEQSGRLPTESEWEFAARGSDGRVYPWGDDAPGRTTANACGTECLAWAKQNGVESDFPGAMYDADDGHATTAPVGSFPAGKSRYGVEDVVGNVAEWTADYYAPYPSDVATTLSDPKGPTSGTTRVIRGGAWNAAFAAWARPTFRFQAPPTQRSHGIGFRCVYNAR